MVEIDKTTLTRGLLALVTITALAAAAPTAMADHEECQEGELDEQLGNDSDCGEHDAYQLFEDEENSEDDTLGEDLEEFGGAVCNALWCEPDEGT